MTNAEVILKCLDNTYDIENREEQGLLWFGKYFFPDILSNNYSEAHFKMTQLYFELLCPNRKTAMDRQAYMLIHREAAKSTVGSFLMPLYSIYMKGYKPIYKQRNLDPKKFRNLKWEKEDDKGEYNIVQIPTLSEKFILIASETSSQSEIFVTDIKTQIETNKKLREVFGDLHPESIDLEANDPTLKRKKSTKWTRSSFITGNKTAVVGVGSGQRVRGLKINGSRPTSIIVDDMYSEENVKTEERREGLNRWFYNALKNSLDSISGKIWWLGTMVHPDIVAKNFKEDDLWFGLEIPIIAIDELKIALDTCKHTEDGKMELPSLKRLAELNDQMTTLSWKDRYPIEHVLKKYIEQLNKGKIDYFYQEFMNLSIAPDSETVPEEAFEIHTSLKFFTDSFGNSCCSYKDKNNIQWEGKVNLRVGVDMASALHKKADDTAITVGGYGRFYPMIPGLDSYNSDLKYPKGVILPVLAHVEGGKYDIIAYDDSQGEKSVVDALNEITRKFDVEKIVIEANGQQEQSIRAIKSTLREKGNNCRIEPQYTNTEKSQRIKATLLPIFQKYRKMICVNNPKVKTIYKQLIMLTISDKDDYPDALEKAFCNIRIPDEGKIYKSKLERSNNKQNDLEEALGKDAWYYL